MRQRNLFIETLAVITIILWLTFCAYAFLFADEADAATLKLPTDTTRIHFVDGFVGNETIASSYNIRRNVETSTSPIWIMINSPGGSVFAGLQMVGAIEYAKSRNVKVVCVNVGRAMSMAFYIYASCTKKYSYKKALLLWHPIRIKIVGFLKPRDIEKLYISTNQLEVYLLRRLLLVAPLKGEQFLWHYYNETVWLADQLWEHNKNWHELIDGVKQ